MVYGDLTPFMCACGCGAFLKLRSRFIKNHARGYQFKRPHKRIPLSERFWEKVDKTETCWNWTSALNRKGYGHIWNGTKAIAAHRASWEMHNGPIPDGMFVCHHCDNPRCVRPDHLFVGTATDNLRDMHSKGRGNQSRPRARNPRAKLTEAQVAEIRHRYAAGGISYSQLAHDYPVNDTMIGFIVTGKNW